MNYEESIGYIHSVARFGSRPGLERISALCKLLGDPQKGLKYVHVAGTNGKGSVCAMCESVLRAAGYRVGLYTSPYIVRFNERMCVDGEPVSDDELAKLTTAVRSAAEEIGGEITEFEIITAVAFLYFRRHECDIVVLEVGMGGRLDATNVIDLPEVSVVTGIALDHTAVLGDTVEKIAFEKAGIIKKRRPAVYGGRDDSAFGVIAARCGQTGSKLTRTNVSAIKVESETLDGTRFSYGGLKGMRLSLCGDYQPENAATVIETVRALRRRGWSIPQTALRAGLAGARWKARFELLSRRDPTVIFDGSHNPQGVAAAVRSVKNTVGRKVILLMGVLADKSYDEMVGSLAAVAERVYTVTPPSPRALGANELAKRFAAAGVPVAGTGGIDETVAAALADARSSKTPLVMLGSLYMYGECLKAFEKHSADTKMKTPASGLMKK